jgi:hypothetical protein
MNVIFTCICLLNISIYGLLLKCGVSYFYLYKQNKMSMLQLAFPSQIPLPQKYYVVCIFKEIVILNCL